MAKPSGQFGNWEKAMAAVSLKDLGKTGQHHNCDLKMSGPSWDEYAKVLSFIYCICTTLTGLIFPISEALTGNWLNTIYNAIFLTFMSSVGTIFLFYLQFYILREVGNNPKYIKQTDPPPPPPPHPSTSLPPPPSPLVGDGRHSQSSRVSLTESMMSESHRRPPRDDSSIDGNNNNNNKNQLFPSTVNVDALSSSAEDEDAEIAEDDESVAWIDISRIGNLFDHYGSSLFLRIGALLFGLCNVIYYGLEIASNLGLNPQCNDPYLFGWTFIPCLIFVVAQTFFIFKVAEVRITKHVNLVWFVMFHLIATNMCLWLRNLIKEIIDELNANNILTQQNNTTNPTVSPVVTIDPRIMNNTNESNHINSLNPATTTAATGCGLGSMDTASHYVFPFVLELSLTAIGIIASIMSSGIHSHDVDDVATGLRNFVQVFSLTVSAKSIKGNVNDDRESGDALSKSHCGSFLGVLVLGSSIIVIIVFFLFNGVDSVTQELLYLGTDFVLHVALLVATIAAFIFMQPLAYLKKPMSTDDVLLLIGMCGSIIYELAIILASAVSIADNDGNDFVEPLRLVQSLLSTIQTVLQTLLILLALRRYPAKEEHVVKMPGRGTFAFLIVGNLAVWVLRTVLARNVTSATLSDFYGEVEWLLIMNINLPILLFQRFHCSVCFADVWSIAYTPLHHKLKTIRPTASAAADDDDDDDSCGAEPSTMVAGGGDGKGCPGGRVVRATSSGEVVPTPHIYLTHPSISSSVIVLDLDSHSMRLKPSTTFGSTININLPLETTEAENIDVHHSVEATDA